ncbi:MAG: SUMF1/EgtB/PvdO family nonheme iron enzyme [Spirochaetes bacterium]|nr:SUMF1/EgtB/PvdO family nonheme iron enzyme [Spirochaetota bacterium]
MKSIRACLAMSVLIAALWSFAGCALLPERNSGLSLQTAIRQAVENMEQNLQHSNVVAVLNINSASEAVSAYIIEEMLVAIAASPQLTAVARLQLELVRQELGFQHSGDVSDETARAMGRMLGAQYVVTGDLVAVGGNYRLRIMAINVETAAINAASSVLIGAGDETLTFLASTTPPAAAIQPAVHTASQGAPQGVPQGGQRIISPAGIAAVRIPAGAFTMGSPANEAGRWGNEGPQRQVRISSGFWMGVYPVTQEEWIRVMGGNPSHFSNNPAAGETQGRRPVEGVSWYDALVFANRLSIMEGLSPAYRIAGSTNPDDWGPVPASRNAFWDAVEVVPGSAGWRLPTEAQWEYAARAGTAAAFSNAAENWENEASLGQIGWFSFNSGGMTREVGLRQPNAWGLHDMHGNVWEWVWDRFAAYPSQAQTDPAGAASGAFRVFRGGSWFYSAQFARSAFRVNVNPFFRQPNLGLRLVRP